MHYQEGHYYHVYNRGAHRSAIFFEEENYRFLIRRINKCTKKFHITLVAYCLMPNHYHLLLRVDPGGNMGQCLRSVFTSFTQAMNKRYLLSGTLFQGQCKRKHVRSQQHCLHLIRYIHRNPLKAQLVKDISDWEFSDYHLWVDESKNSRKGSDIRDAMFGSGAEYRRFVDEFDEDDKTILKSIVFNEE
ncbi:MAG: transposase [Bacteroidetes bacterium]|nr:transposase [Bacteroidota bacterium]